MTETYAPPFAGKVALVTGASSGIGAATARLLAERGAAVAVNYHRSKDRAEELAEKLTSAGARAMAVQADVTDEAQTRSMVEETEVRLGPLDVLVLNAAGVRGHEARIAPTVDLAWEDVAFVAERQLKAIFHPVKATLPGFLERGSGSIVMVGAALARRQAAGFLALALAKSGVEAAVKTLAREVGPRGIRVNGVGPGLILSPIGERMPEAARRAAAERAALRRNGTPEDVAEVIAFLASDHASYLTGEYMLVDGGTAMI
ncbi:SDR family NAD(P)-dependent oxidoreductase [Actinoallomurus sp. CA-150999]|uniref:SDR family NAD(P)-dependent oxidoreductase n=1 Tax=Actinoallomurus sp. CA-150999 TaxID=3239887 RepID=UPI003D90E6B4